jgi:hypothetical protein
VGPTDQHTHILRGFHGPNESVGVITFTLRENPPTGSVSAFASHATLTAVLFFLILAAPLLVGIPQRQADSPLPQTPPQFAQTNSKHPAVGGEIVKYVNTNYRFAFSLPRSWKGYSVVAKRWQDTPQDQVRLSGPEITIRHPQWTDENRCDRTLRSWSSRTRSGTHFSKEILTLVRLPWGRENLGTIASTYLPPSCE